MAIASITTDDGMTIQSNSETQAELEASFAPPAIEDVPAVDPTTAVDADPDAALPTRAITPKPRNRRDDPRVAVQSAVAKQREAERERDRLAAELASLKKPPVAAAPEPEVKSAETVAAVPASAAPPAAPVSLPPATAADWQRYQAMPNAPKRAEFQDPSDWQVALNLFVADTRFAELRALESEQQQTRYRETQATQRARDIYQKITENGANTEVLGQIDPVLINTPPLEALGKGAKPLFGNFLMSIAYKARNPREVLLHLSNKAEQQRLVTLPPDEVVRTLTEFDLSIAPPAAATTGTAPKATLVSQAKPVFAPVSGTATAGTDDPPGDDASDAAYEAYWGPRRKSRRR